jgi:hypothetical protein
VGIADSGRPHPASMRGLYELVNEFLKVIDSVIAEKIEKT